MGFGSAENNREDPSKTIVGRGDKKVKGMGTATPATKQLTREG